MPQIAQQDYIRLHINDINLLTDAEKAGLKKIIANGTLFDCIIESQGVFYRVNSYEMPKGVDTNAYINLASDELITIEIDYSDGGDDPEPEPKDNGGVIK